MAHFYISHGTVHYEAAKKLADYLIKSSFDVWQVTEAEQMTALWHGGVDDGVAALVLMSPALADNKLAQEERAFIAKLRKPIIPILLEGSVFPTYRSLPHVDMSKGNVPENILLSFLRMHGTAGKGKGQIIVPDEESEVEAEITSSELTAMAKPKELQALTKAMRDGLGTSPRPPSMSDELKKLFKGKKSDKPKS